MTTLRRRDDTDWDELFDKLGLETPDQPNTFTQWTRGVPPAPPTKSRLVYLSDNSLLPPHTTR